MATFLTPEEGVADALQSMGYDGWIIEGNNDGFVIHEPELTAEEMETLERIRHRDVPWRRVRTRRDNLLSQSDWLAASDRSMSTEEREYRQALRNITSQSDPENITWPTKPASLTRSSNRHDPA